MSKKIKIFPFRNVHGENRPCGKLKAEQHDDKIIAENLPKNFTHAEDSEGNEWVPIHAGHKGKITLVRR